MSRLRNSWQLFLLEKMTNLNREANFQIIYIQISFLGRGLSTTVLKEVSYMTEVKLWWWKDNGMRRKETVPWHVGRPQTLKFFKEEQISQDAQQGKWLWNQFVHSTFCCCKNLSNGKQTRSTFSFYWLYWPLPLSAFESPSLPDSCIDIFVNKIFERL